MKILNIYLSSMDSADTIKNDYAIKNDKTSYSNKTTAFVQRQRYSYLDDLKGKRFTSEL